MEAQIKSCQNCKKDFTIETEDFNFYERVKVPPPTFCPTCRAERRFVFRNERKFFKAKDALSGKEIFSLYPSELGKKSIIQEEFFSDNCDATDYGVNYNFSVNIFEQISKLEKEVPVQALRVEYMVNSPYCANATSLKNSYLCFNSSYSEDCMYSNTTDYSKDCVDNSHVKNCERCYECFWLEKCYQCYFTIMSVESHNLWFCRDCLGCNDCFGCVNLRKSSYCIFNKQYTKEEYENEIIQMRLDTTQGIKNAREITREFWKTQLYKYNQGLKNLNSTGSYVTNCKNVNDSFLMRECENAKYSQYLQVPKSKDCYDTTAWGDDMELHYETCLCGGNSYDIKFSTDSWPNCKNLEYCISLFSCSDCFACVGLKKKQYCILNKQYEKGEYFEMVKKIKQHMDEMPYIDKKGNIYKYGEFFPIELSPFGYNNTMAIQYFEMTQEKAKENNYPWVKVPHGEYAITIKSSDLPNSLDGLGDEILKEVIKCGNCQNAYRILENEFIFYKKEKLPLPTICHECRFRRRINDRLKLELYERKCMCNGEKDITNIYTNTLLHSHGDNPCVEIFKTGYSPENPEIVYCEKCYQQEVY